jgi:hypothetical protein
LLRWCLRSFSCPPVKLLDSGKASRVPAEKLSI